MAIIVEHCTNDSGRRRPEKVGLARTVVRTEIIDRIYENNYFEEDRCRTSSLTDNKNLKQKTCFE